ncbi:MAG: organic hydroperoxide resistance protein [Actinomycetota bacterium]|nr:organic hydroperoxide resistance protein [Actinomycetota bacterium]
MERLYTAEATAYGQRTGSVVSPDDRVDLQLSRPAEMGGDGGPGTNPEQLFAAGYAACFHSAMRFGVPQLGLPKTALDGSSVTARVSFVKEAPTEFGLAVELVGSLPQLDREQAQRLMEVTHTICPYSRATRGNVPVELTVA